MNNNLETGKVLPEHYFYLIVDYHSLHLHTNTGIKLCQEVEFNRQSRHSIAE